MFTERIRKQNKPEMVILDELVPQDNLLRKIDKAIDFGFINKICKPYYCENNGHPAIEPEVIFRMLFIGYLYGIRSEIRLLKEIEVNVAYRWFIGYDLTEKLSNASVIWQNRLRRYNVTDVPQQIFDEIVRQAMAKGFVGGKMLYSDSTCNKSGEVKTIKVSTTDPDSGFMHRDGKPQRFFYLDHRTVDSKHYIVFLQPSI